MSSVSTKVTYLRAIVDRGVVLTSQEDKSGVRIHVTAYESGQITHDQLCERLHQLHPNFLTKAEQDATSASITVPTEYQHHSLHNSLIEGECEESNEITCSGSGTARGVFCKCSDASTVVETAVATGNTDANVHRANMYVCMSLVQSFGADYYYSPAGTSASCVHFDPGDIGTLCHMMLTGDVTSCGDA
ncbi:MAG: hypothetical protein RLN62_06570 [Rickettsiales bacterium]